MAKTITPEQLSAEVDLILHDYQNHVIVGMASAIKQLANKGRNAVRRNARAVTSKSRRRYSNGWMYQMDTGSNRWAAGAVIFEKKQPGLAHLLEHGHAKANGGRTRAREHIKPVSDQIANEITGAVKKEISK